MLTNPQRDIQPEIIPGRTYDGYVINNVDATNPVGTMDRSQIRIPGFHTGVPDADLPWADHHHSVGVNGAAPGMGEVKPLPLYSKVRVEFLDKDGYHPIITAVPKTTDLMIPGLHDDPDYPHLFGSVDNRGALTKSKTQDAKTDPTSDLYTHPSGAGHHLDKNGNLNLNFGNIVINCSGLTVHCSGNIVLDGLTGITKVLSCMADVIWGSNTSAIKHTHNQGADSAGDAEVPVDPPNPNTSVNVPSQAAAALVPRTPPVIKNMANQVNLSWLLPFVISLVAFCHKLA
jgi:hypothetical protein